MLQFQQNRLEKIKLNIELVFLENSNQIKSKLHVELAKQKLLFVSHKLTKAKSQLMLE